MKKIAVVGSGQAGTLIALGLQRVGYDVTLIESMTPDQMRVSRVRSTAAVWDHNTAFETELGVGFWDDCNSRGTHIRVQFRDIDSTVVCSIWGKLDSPVSGIDQRTKFPRFIEEFIKRGGNFLVQSVTIADIDELASKNDLVFVAVGKGEIGKLFEIDRERTIFDAPPRNNCAMLLKNVKEWDHIVPRSLKFEFYKSTGDWFGLPFYADGVGECRAFVFQAVHGTEMDVFDDARTSNDILDRMRWLVKTYAPEDWDHMKNAELIDDQAWLRGGIVPTAKKPIGVLPSGRKVLAIGDTAITHEPICGCGANAAIRQARDAVHLLADNTHRAVSIEEVASVVEKEYREHGQHIFDFVRSITGDMTPPAWLMMQAAHHAPTIRHMFANMYMDFAKSRHYLNDMNVVRHIVEANAAELTDANLIPFETAFPELAQADAAAE